jgi:sortase A
MRSSLKRSLGWVEAGFYLSGLALLSVFFVLRFEGENQRAAGVAAFEAAAASSALAGNANGEPAFVPGSAPDQSLWAEKRIREYQQSLTVNAEPPLGVMTIERLGIEVPVYDGASDLNLNRGVGRIKGTARIDAQGNLGIAGHRDGFFRALKDIAPGDQIRIRTMRNEAVYAVSSIEIVDPDDVSVLAPTETMSVTLVTCYPFYYVGHAPKRFIVKAEAEHFLAIN